METRLRWFGGGEAKAFPTPINSGVTDPRSLTGGQEESSKGRKYIGGGVEAPAYAMLLNTPNLERNKFLVPFTTYKIGRAGGFICGGSYY